MAKNDFDIDFDFEKEYGFDPKEILDSDFSDEELDFSEFSEEDATLDSQEDEFAEEDLGVLSDIPGEGILAVGTDFCEMIVEGVKDYKLYGAVTSSPYDIGQNVLEELVSLSEGEEESSIDVYYANWYAAYNIEEDEIVRNIGVW